MQRFDRAIALLLEELEVAGDSADAWSSLGLSYACSGNVARGEQCLRRALGFDPKHFNAYHNLAVLYATQGKREATEQILKSAFELDSQRTSDVLFSDPSLATFQSLVERWSQSER
jgi:Flp pilus assembly protein TadD